MARKTKFLILFLVIVFSSILLVGYIKKDDFPFSDDGKDQHNAGPQNIHYYVNITNNAEIEITVGVFFYNGSGNLSAQAGGVLEPGSTVELMVIMEEGEYSREIIDTGCMYEHILVAQQYIDEDDGTLCIDLYNNGVNATWGPTHVR